MLQEIMGHASITTTLDLYGHLYLHVTGAMGVILARRAAAI
jgi:integrase